MATIDGLELLSGLAKFDGTNWTVYDTTNSGLPDNAVVSLAIDGSDIWIGTIEVDSRNLMALTGQFTTHQILACLITVSGLLQ